MTTPTKMELAERVEQAEGRDPELNAAIHEQLFGTADVGGYTFYRLPNGNGANQPLDFTGRFEDAEQALPGPEWPEYQITRRFCTGYHASIGTGPDGVGCETAALALTAAALRALAAQEDHHDQG